ncbi:CFI-box-CTERM domain-containing protein [Acidithiobacillus sp. AC3]
MAKRGRKKTPASIFNPRGETQKQREKRVAMERKRYGRSGPCFIATAVYGDPYAPEVNAIRRFRDRWLRPNALGRSVIYLYYKLSPAVANKIRNNNKLRAFIKIFLDPLARKF